MPIEHSVVVVTGLGGANPSLSPSLQFWRHYDLSPIIFDPHWRDGEPFALKLTRILDLVDDLSRAGNKVSLVGTSAGGCAVLDTFTEKPHQIYKVVNICGRLREGTHSGFRSFEKRTASSPAFVQAVAMFADREGNLTQNDRSRILTLHALWGLDELVPAETTYITGATNLMLPVPEHLFSISMALTVFSQPLINFLTN
jgi:dienelactone hydrolase